MNIKFKKYFPFYLRIMTIISLSVFFIKPLNSLLNSTLVSPILSTFENNIASVIMLAILAIGLLIWIWIYGSRRFIIVLALIATAFYLLMRTSGYWIFYTYPPLPILSDWDLILLALTLPLIRIVFAAGSEEELPVTEGGFIEDLAIEDAKMDSFKRNLVAKEIAKKIGHTTNKRSFAIGILGEYGSGKTSFLNLIKKNLDTKNVALIDFNPWSAEGSSNIQKDFFDLLASRLRELDPKISSLVLDYSRKLSGTDSAMEKLIKQSGLAGSLLSSNSYADDYEQINTLLKETDKKIVITVDDVDRLYNDEVMEVLRLIRNTGNFANIFYLVAYERNFVDQAIKSLNVNAGNSFLDKIIQLEIPIPKRESNDLLDFLETHLFPFLAEDQKLAYKDHIIESGFKFGYDFAFDKVFRQSRDVIKFVNNFKLTYGLMGKEVMFENIFILELLKFRFPLIYDRLFENRSEFVSEHLSRSKHQQYYELLTYKEGDRNQLSITKTLRAEGKYEENELRLISGLLTNLFFGFDRSKKAKNSIIYPMFFERYFRYRLSNREISEKQFLQAYENGLEATKTYIDLQGKHKMLNDVATRIFQEKPATREAYELKVYSLFYLGPKFIREKGRHSFDTEALTDLIWNYEHNLDKKFYKKDEAAFASFIQKVLGQAPFPYLFHNEIIYHIKKGSKEISVAEEKLSNFQLDYFTKHVEQAGLSEEALYLFWWSRYKEFVPLPENPGRGHEYLHFEKPIAEAMRKFIPELDPFHFLKYSIKYDIRDREIYFIHPEVLEMFRQKSELRNLVQDHKVLDQTVKQDYLALYDACEANGFKDWGRIEFKTALKPDRSSSND